jgi:glycerophosphoryl diester phosphodiesterase
MSSSKTTHDQNPPLGVFDKQGHRGCRGLMPENTIPAMLRALELGVTTLEVDVVISKDKKVVMSHEPWFNADITTLADGSYIDPVMEKEFNIYRMDYDRVKSFDVGMRPYPAFPRQQKMKAIKPLLAELIDHINEYCKNERSVPYYNIEIKSEPGFDDLFQPAPNEFTELVMNVIKEKEIGGYTNIQSFDFRILQYMHQQYPSFSTAILIEDFDKRSLTEQIEALGYIPVTYSPAFKLVNEELVKQCHEQNMKIIPWTVNDKAKMEELKKTGVDGIITDYPDLFN